MSFLNPERLWLLVLVVGLATAYLLLQRRRTVYAVRFTNLELLDRVAPKRPGWRRHVPAVAFLLAISTLVVAFARPTRQERVPRERATIIMAIDTSLSMEATDVAPSRIEAAKVAAAAFVDLLPPKINLGLVAFNGNASLKVAPTTDRDQVRNAIANLQLGQRTAIGEAIFTSLDAIAQVPPDDKGTPAPARIVLMSDGSTTDGRPNDEAVQAANEQGVPVSTIAFGTAEGTVTLPDQPIPVNVPVDKDALKAIADATQGKFYEAASEGELKSVYADIGSSVGYTTEEREATGLWVGISLVMLFATAGISLTWFSRLP